jgi:hypothetical protein
MQERKLRPTDAGKMFAAALGSAIQATPAVLHKSEQGARHAYSGFGRVMIFVSTKWLEKTQSLSLEEHGLLVDLVLTAAIFESPTLPLTVEALLVLARNEDRRAHIIEVFAELCRLELVCEISPGLFEIAAGLWRLEESAWKGEA